jgi:hypothetical protein
MTALLTFDGPMEEGNVPTSALAIPIILNDVILMAVHASEGCVLHQKDRRNFSLSNKVI